jgi:hypothetical protein
MMGENARSIEIPIAQAFRFLVAGATRIIISPCCYVAIELRDDARERTIPLSFPSPHMRFDSSLLLQPQALVGHHFSGTKMKLQTWSRGVDNFEGKIS